MEFQNNPTKAKGRYFTWKAKDSIIFTLIQAAPGRTVIYCHDNDILYHAHRDIMLPARVPVGTCVLGQYCEDDDAMGCTDPRMLIFDMVAIGWHTLQQSSAKERYNMLREVVGGGLPVSVESVLRIQWVGEYSCSPSVLSGAMQLPHEIEGLLILSNENSNDLLFEPSIN